MPINRRQFIKRSATAVTVSLVMPKLWLGRADARDIAAADRRIFLVIQMAGGNDGLNTLVPYADSRYQQLRPTLGFKDTELKDAQGNSTILNSSLGLHPSLSEIKQLFDANRVAVVTGVGYPSPNLSHFLSQDIWQTANTNGGAGNGWLGKYADQKLVGGSGLAAVSVGGSLPKAMFADHYVAPNISPANGNDPFANYQYLTDGRNAGDRNNQLNTFKALSTRGFDAGSFMDAIAKAGFDAEEGAAQLRTAVQGYSSSVTYPTSSLASAMKMVAQIATTVPAANLFYVQQGGYDHHSAEIGSTQAPTDKTVGQHANLLGQLSQSIKAFYDDMAAHGLADNVVLMTWSEFGRRPNENASRGTDHGTSSVQLVVGNPVHGGVYGEQPSLSDLDSAGNMKFKVDFRATYATILDRWLGADSKTILGGTFENIGFLG
ncbi:MAG TPA: DUF1501 domain-containing protein [Blastocatellia bacterium]|nr:DUF1501 domain-containing protein [Blastocatellia bacterium]